MSGGRDPRLPFSQIDEAALPPRDPIVGYVKVGGKGDTVRFARGTGKPWLGPARYVNPPRFEIVTREKDVRPVKGQGKAKGETFNVDFGYKRDEEYHKAVGAAPTSLRIRLYYPKWHQNLVSFFGAWGSAGWECRGNGVEAIDAKRGECPCPCPRLKQFEGQYKGTAPRDSIACKPHGQLNVILEDAGVFPAFWPFKTTSFESIANIRKSLQDLERVFGRLDGLPLELRVMAATKAFDRAGGQTTQPIVTVVLAASMNSARQIASEAAEEARKYLPVIPDAEEEAIREAMLAEMEEEAESVAEEFHPEEPELEDAEEEPSVEELEAELDEDPDDDDGPDHEIVGEEEEDAAREEGEATEMAGPVPDHGEPEGASLASGDFDRNDEELLEELCARTLATRQGWSPEMIAGRIAHTKSATGRGLEHLASFLRSTMPDAWAMVEGELFEELGKLEQLEDLEKLGPNDDLGL